MFVTNWISTTKIQKISEITNFFRHYFLSRTEVSIDPFFRLPIESIELHTASIIGVKYVVWALIPFTIPKIFSLLIINSVFIVVLHTFRK